MAFDFTCLQQMVLVRQAVLTAKCSVQYRTNASSHEYKLKKYEGERVK